MRRRTFLLGAPIVTAPAWLTAQENRGSLSTLVWAGADGLWIRDLPAGRTQCIASGANIESPRISPSGRWVAYRRDETACVVARDGSRGARLPGEDFQWRPDRDDLIVEDSVGLHLFPGADDSKPPALSIPDAFLPVAFRPDGAELVYADSRNIDSDSRVGRICRGKQVIAEFQGDQPILCRWMSKGDELLYWLDPDFSGSARADGLELFRIPASGGPPKSLGISTLVKEDFIAVAPAGDALAVAAGDSRDSCENKRIGVIDWPGGSVRYLTGEGTAAVSPTWSPDGKRIAFSAAPSVRGGCGGSEPMREALARRRIHIVDAKGTGAPALLRDDEDYRDEEPQWSADGRHILFCRVSGANKQTIWMMRADGGEAEEVAGPLAVEDEDSAWFGYYGTIDWRNAMDWRRSK